VVFLEDFADLCLHGSAHFLRGKFAFKLFVHDLPVEFDVVADALSHFEVFACLGVAFLELFVDVTRDDELFPLRFLQNILDLFLACLVVFLRAAAFEMQAEHVDFSFAFLENEVLGAVFKVLVGPVLGVEHEACILVGHHRVFLGFVEEYQRDLLGVHGLLGREHLELLQHLAVVQGFEQLAGHFIQHQQVQLLLVYLGQDCVLLLLDR